MAGKKYVALKDFGDFKEGDGVSVAEAGDDADRLLADGLIKLADEDSSKAPESPKGDGQSSQPPAAASVSTDNRQPTTNDQAAAPASPQATTVTGPRGTITATFA